MPSPIAHSVTGYALSQLPSAKAAFTLREAIPLIWIPLYGAFISVLPDFDFIPQVITGLRFHRGPSHSLLAALLVSLLLPFIVCTMNRKINRQKKRQIPFGKLFAFTLICYSAHLAMDAVTAGGTGMRLLWPISGQDFRAPFSLFPPVRHSHGLWEASHLVFISVELVYSLIILYALGLVKAKSQPAKNSQKGQF